MLDHAAAPASENTTSKQSCGGIEPSKKATTASVDESEKLVEESEKVVEVSSDEGVEEIEKAIHDSEVDLIDMKTEEISQGEILVPVPVSEKEEASVVPKSASVEPLQSPSRSQEKLSPELGVSQAPVETAKPAIEPKVPQAANELEEPTKSTEKPQSEVEKIVESTESSVTEPQRIESEEKLAIEPKTSESPSELAEPPKFIEKATAEPETSQPSPDELEEATKSSEKPLRPSSEKKRPAPKAPTKEEIQLAAAKLESDLQKSPLAMRNIRRIDDKRRQPKTGWL